MPRPTILAVFGPTGAGKTALAIALADVLRARGDDPVAVSVDALQVYAGLEVLTGVASPAEQARLEHRLVSFVPLQETFAVGEHAARAHAEIDGLLAAGRTPIVVGGTGLYLRAALTDLRLRPVAPAAVRERWMEALRRDGPAALHAELARRAPWAAEPVSPQDSHRIVRLLELDDVGALHPPDQDELWTEHTRHPTRLIGVTLERDELYARIDARVDGMIAAGAVEEVRVAVAAGASETARKALGFRELAAGAGKGDALAGAGEGDARAAADPAAIERMKRRTRNYAKRQLTWMRKLPGVELVDLTGRDPASVAAELLSGDR